MIEVSPAPSARLPPAGRAASGLAASALEPAAGPSSTATARMKNRSVTTA